MVAVLLPVSFKVCAGKTTTENAGDILQILLPLSAYASTFYIGDTVGRYQFYRSLRYRFICKLVNGNCWPGICCIIIFLNSVIFPVHNSVRYRGAYYVLY